MLSYPQLFQCLNIDFDAVVENTVIWFAPVCQGMNQPSVGCVLSSYCLSHLSVATYYASSLWHLP